MPIRTRLLLAYLLAAVVLVGGGGWWFDRQLSAGLIASVDTALQARAAEVEQAVPDTGEINFQDEPERLSAPRSAFTQLVDPRGTVIEASEAVGPQPVLTPAEFALAIRGPRHLTGRRGGEAIRLLAIPVRRQSGVWVVVVGTSLEPGQATLAEVQRGLLAGGVTLVLLGAFGVWILAGAALRPVERMRRTAARIDVAGVPAGVEVPATGDELARLASTLNELLARQHRMLQRQRRLIADAGHELRAPLAVLQAELELAARPGRSREDLVAAVDTAVGETGRLIRLANNMLLLARHDEGETVVRPEEQPWGPVLRAAVDAAGPRAAGRGVGLRLDVPDDLRAPVDADRLRQAVDNLLDNALHAAPPGTDVVVRARPAHDVVTVDVLDRGPGFPAAFLPEAFQRFHRADTARGRDSGGAGLGLAIVRATAEAHGGRAEAANRPSGGAVVRIILPIPPTGDTTSR